MNYNRLFLLTSQQ